MKILRNLVILVFAAFIVASCEKSHVTPHNCGGDKSQAQEPAATPANSTQAESNGVISGRSSIITDGEETTQKDGSRFNGNGNDGSTEVSGSGDDDRDGGERRRKR